EKLDWINKEDLSEDLTCVLDMKKGTISAPIPDRETSDIVKLVKVADKRERRLKILNERYAEIDQLLQQNKRLDLSQQMEKVLKERATIIYF
ncbi:MAG: hypothetical protein WCT20_04305, partial [Candidatus Babeliales bacterium]